MLEIFLKFTKASLFQHRTVKELLWGYRDTKLPVDTGLFVSVSTEAAEGHIQTSNRTQ